MSENNNKEIFTKEDFLKEINDFEEKWMKMLDVKEFELKKEMTDIKENSTDILQKSKILLEKYSTEKLRDSRISELEAFKNKVNDMLLTHEIRINNNIKDIANFSSKYEKIISENFLVPGFVGPSCQYKTLSEYIIFNINEVSKIKAEKDIVKRDQKESRSKMDSFMKQMLVLNESTMVQSREYVNGKQKDIISVIDGKLQPLDDKIFRFYQSSLQFQSNVEKEIKGFRNDIERILKIKEEIIEIINEKEEQLNNKLEQINKKVVMNIQDIGINKNKILQITNEIKEINKNYDKLNNKINDIYKQINKLPDTSNPYKKNAKDLRRSVNPIFFMNKLNKGNLSLSSSIKEKNRNNTENATEREEKDEEEKTYNKKNEDLKDIKEIKDNNEINNELKDDINDENKKTLESDKNDLKSIEMKIQSKLMKNKSDNKNKLEKNKYKTFYNKIIKEKDDDIEFETFYMGKTKIPIIKKPFLLDQRILSDEEMRLIYRERLEKNKEKLKIEKIRKNFLNYDLNSKNNKNKYKNNKNKGKNLDINYYKLSIPKLTPNQKSDEKLFYQTNYDKKRMKEINNEFKFNNNLAKEKKYYRFSPNTKNNIKSLNLVNLKLDGSIAINPETNNGAYVLAKKQLENERMSRINYTPTSYIFLNDISKGTKTSKLVSMTFMKEEQKMLNSFSNTLENEENRMKLDVTDLYKNVKFFKEK